MGSRVQYSVETKRSSLVKIRILVVDDDSTALLVVTEVLKKWNYEVTGVKNPLDAISTLRMRRGLFDLIVTDYHMPIMNGLELQQRILEEFNLPVIMMSVDNNECLMLKSLECGAAYFILKPVKPIDCKNIWQYAVARTKSSTKSTAIAIRHNFPAAKSLNINNSFSCAAANSHAALSSIVVAHVNNSIEAPIANLQAPPQALKGAAKTNVPCKSLKAKENAIKKPKVAWTNFLHNRFLQAVNFIGIEKAVPKKILELMNIPGLTRQNVASHLQKYRIFLRRVAEKGKENQLKALNDVFFENPSLVTMPHPPSMMAATASRARYPHQMTPVRLSSLSSSQLELPWGSSSSNNISNDWGIGTDGFPSPATDQVSRFNNQQIILGSVALSRPNMLSSPMDNQAISQYSATTDSTDQITGSKPATTFQYNPGGANRNWCQLSSTIPVSNSEKYITGLSNCEQGSHGKKMISRFFEISSPLDLCTSNNSSSTAARQPSHLGINHQVQLNNDGIMSQVPDSTEIYGEVAAGAACNNQGNYGENNNGCSQLPKLVDGDLFDMLIDYFPDLLNGVEEVMETTPVGNGSNGQAADLQVSDARISNINNATVDQLEDNLWDYEELKQPGPPSLLLHQPEQTVPGNDDAALDKDWDEVEFIESLLASVSPSPDRD